MHSLQLLTKKEAPAECCPFEAVQDGTCSASLSMMEIGSHTRARFCSGDNYDSCPVFLARVLRKR